MPMKKYKPEQIVTLLRQVEVELAARLAPHSRHTDILGALLVAGQLFEETPGSRRKVLVIYSDMRQDTPEVRLQKSVSSFALQKAVNESSSAGLRGVDVYAAGVDASGSNAEDWRALERFWAEYFSRMGRTLNSIPSCVTYSVSDLTRNANLGRRSVLHRTSLSHRP